MQYPGIVARLMGRQYIFLFQNEEPQVWAVLLDFVSRGHTDDTPADDRYIKKFWLHYRLLNRKDNEVIRTLRAKPHGQGSNRR